MFKYKRDYIIVKSKNDNIFNGNVNFRTSFINTYSKILNFHCDIDITVYHIVHINN